MKHLLVLSGSVIKVVENHLKLSRISEMKVFLPPHARDHGKLKKVVRTN